MLTIRRLPFSDIAPFARQLILNTPVELGRANFATTGRYWAANPAEFPALLRVHVTVVLTPDGEIEATFHGESGLKDSTAKIADAPFGWTAVPAGTTRSLTIGQVFKIEPLDEEEDDSYGEFVIESRPRSGEEETKHRSLLLLHRGVDAIKAAGGAKMPASYGGGNQVGIPLEHLRAFDRTAELYEALEGGCTDAAILNAVAYLKAMHALTPPQRALALTVALHNNGRYHPFNVTAARRRGQRPLQQNEAHCACHDAFGTGWALLGL